MVHTNLVAVSHCDENCCPDRDHCDNCLSDYYYYWLDADNAIAVDKYCFVVVVVDNYYSDFHTIVTDYSSHLHHLHVDSNNYFVDNCLHDRLLLLVDCVDNCYFD